MFVAGRPRIHTWNVQGVGEIARGTIKGAELLRNFTAVGDYGFFPIQEHKLRDRVSHSIC